MNGRTVYICQFNKPDINKKALRNVPPIKCIVSCNSQLPERKTVYYSESHYNPLNKKKLPTSKIISPQDNTGFRSFSGNSLYTFYNLEDCIELWNYQLDEYIERIDFTLENYKTTLNEEKNKVINMHI